MADTLAAVDVDAAVPVAGSSGDAAVQLKVALDKIRHQTTSNLIHQKRPATLLVAIEATLSEQGAALTPVAYFAALLSTIQQLVATAAAATAAAQDNDGETLPAALYLFAIVLPFTQQAVLRSKLGTLLELLTPQLAASGEAGTTKSLLALFQPIYLAMDTSTVNSLQAKQAFNALLAYLVDPRPKVRRKAQEVIQAMLANPPAPSVRHPYAGRVAEFVLESLKDALKEGKKGGKRKQQHSQLTVGGDGGNVSEEASRAIGLCAFIKMVGKDWPANYIAPLCALLLSLPRLSSPFLTGASYDILETLFSKSSESFEEGKVEETLEAVLAARPAGTGSVDERILPGWLGTVEHGFVAFARSNPDKCRQSLFSTFSGVLSYLASPAPPVRTAATSTLNALTRYCISNEEVTAAVSAVSGSSGQEQPLLAICDALLAALKSIKFQAVAMPHLLSVIASLIGRLRTKVPASNGAMVPAASLLLAEHVKLAGHQRGIEGFEYREAAELVLGAATEVCGPEWVLDLLPLNLDSEEQSEKDRVGRAWLLPVFRTKITNTRMAHFTTHFVPLSERMFGKYREAESRADMEESEQLKKRAGIEAKVYEAVVHQIWALFPGYCDLPVDLSEAFTKQFCEILSNVLYSQAHLRAALFRGLQRLVERNNAVVASSSTDEVLIESLGVDHATAKQNIQLLSGLAANLLAVMFNVFSKSGKQGRGYVLDCISAYLSILSPKDLTGTFNKIRTILLQGLSAAPTPVKPAPGESTVPQTMLDFLVQLVPFLPDVETATSLLKLVLTEDVLQNKDTAVQKKGYRVLVRLCEAGGAVGEQVVRDNLEDIVDELVEKNTSVSAAAKRDRTTLLSTIIPLLPSDKLHLIPSIIPEAVLATKEANEAARGAAYDLLVGMAEKMAKGGVIKRNLIKGADEAGGEETEGEADESMVEDADATIGEYITMVAAGLAGNSPHMISATITALSRLLFEYHTQLDSTTISEMISTILVFLGSANREIVKSSVGFVKVAVVTLAPVDVQPHLEKLIPALLDWSHEHKNHFKLNIRHIFERLIRKFGYDEIEKLTREDDRKLLSNIRKRQMRAKRKKEQQDGMAVDGQESGEENLKPSATRNAYEDALYGSEDDEADSDEDAPAPASKSAAAGKGRAGQQHQAQQQQLRKNAIGRKKGDEQNAAYIQERGDEPLDLLDDRMVGRISRSNPAQEEARRARREEGRDGASSRFRTDEESGKLMFNEDGDEDGGDGAADGEVDSTNAYLEAIRGEDGFHRDARGRVKMNKSTKRVRAQLEEDELLEDVKDRLADLGMQRGGGADGRAAPKQPKRQKKQKESIGQDFKAKKAGGDVKRGDGPNPYAYVPLGNGKKRAGLNIVNKGRKTR